MIPLAAKQGSEDETILQSALRSHTIYRFIRLIRRVLALANSDGIVKLWHSAALTIAPSMTTPEVTYWATRSLRARATIVLL
jgi:hypothetical protein